tara:strand:- start:2769 stop:3611 length:843 start_codon:yes stop_codon:yes gene_type:complete
MIDYEAKRATLELINNITDDAEIAAQADILVFSENKDVITNPYDYDPSDVINTLSELKGDIDYLEVGVDQGLTFNNVNNTNIKHGVDPYGASENITHRMTSQMFFTMNRRFFNNKYDVIFLDGMHLTEFLNYEIFESLNILKDDGIILLHDTCPFKESAQAILREDFDNILRDVISADEKERMSWHENTAKNEPTGYNGDVWKSVAKFRNITDHTIFSIPNACMSVIIPENIKAFKKPPLRFSSDISNLSWIDYYQNFEVIMNPVSMQYFIEHISDWIKR